MCPILFTIGPFTVYAYGVMVALAFIISTLLMQKYAPKMDIPKDKVIDLMIIVLLSGLIGARLLHVAVNFRQYIGDPAEIFFINHGGLAVYGGFLFALPAGIIFLTRNNIPVWKAGDLIAPYLALGQAIGRIGCLLNGCCYGIPVDHHLPGIMLNGEGVLRFPVQILSALCLIAVFAVLRFMLEKGMFRNNLFLVYLALYSFQRFFTEFVRGDVDRLCCRLTASQLISIAVFVLSLLLLRWRYSHGKS